jgi:uncharacterized protein
MALTTLQKMASGGMYDQIGGGFHRYSTDELWHVPHFEKMLYDQAQLVFSYLDAFQITQDPFYVQVVREVLMYVQRVLTHPEGGFYSAEDAESAVSSSYPEKKKEGAYYVWEKSEIQQALNEKEAQIINFIYGIEEKGNVHSDPTGEFAKKNILFVAHSIEEAADGLGEKVEDIQAYVDIAKAKLFDQRQRRPQAHVDDKVLLSWNGLMISAYARASQVLGDDSYLKEAEKASRFLLTKLYDPGTRRLLRRYRDGEAKYDAHLADYAFFIQGLLDLYETSFDITWLQTALHLMEDQTKLFFDAKRGWYYDISGSDPTIFIRTKEAYDGAEPSGNSIAALNLLRFSLILNDDYYYDMAIKSIECFSEYINNAPQALPHFLAAVDLWLSKPIQIVLAGNSKHPVILDMLNEIHSHYLPNKIVLLADAAEGQEFLRRYVPFFENLSVNEGGQKAYVCEHFSCQLPTSDIQTLNRLLTKQIATFH